MRSRPATIVSLASLALLGGCGGGSSTNSPAQFSAKASKVCLAVEPRLKATSVAVTALDSKSGNALDKLPKLAGLLGDLNAEFADLHRGLSAISAPDAQKAAFTVFLTDLDKLQKLTKQGTDDLKPGTISGLRQFKALGTQLDGATSALGADAAKVPGLAACNKLS